MAIIAFAADHAGYELKDVLAEHARALGHDIVDLGTNAAVSVDYPDFARALARAVINGAAELGVLVCGTGIGVAIAANRHRPIRAALCWDATTARFARTHNDANVLCLGARVTGPEVAKDALHAFLTSDYAGGRHAGRVAKLSQPAED